MRLKNNLKNDRNYVSVAKEESYNLCKIQVKEVRETKTRKTTDGRSPKDIKQRITTL